MARLVSVSDEWLVPGGEWLFIPVYRNLETVKWDARCAESPARSKRVKIEVQCETAGALMAPWISTIFQSLPTFLNRVVFIPFL